MTEESGKFTIRSGGDIGNESNSGHLKLIITLIIILVIIGAGVAVLLILYFNNEDDDKKKEDNKQDISYKKAEKLYLLFWTENMKSSDDKEEKRKLCVGKIDPFKNDKVEFKGLCMQDGPAGVRFADGTSISWQAGINNAATFNKSLL